MLHVLPHRSCAHFAEHRLLTVIGLVYGVVGAVMALLGGSSGCPTDSGTGYSLLVVGEIMVTYVRASYQYLSRLNRICAQRRPLQILGITASAPFNGVDDKNLAILTHVIRWADTLKITPSCSEAPFSFPTTLRAQKLIQKNLEKECTFDTHATLIIM